MTTSRTLTDTNQVSRALIAKMLAEGSSGAPIQHWTQGLNRLAQGLVGGLNLSALRGQEKEAEAAKLAQAEADREATSRATSGAIDALFPQSSAVQPPSPPAGSPVAAALGSPQAAVNDRFGSWDTVNVPPQAQPGIVAALGGQPASGGMFGGMPGFAPGERPIGWPEPPAPQTGSMPSARAQPTIPQAAPQPMPQQPQQPPEMDRARLLQVIADPRAPKELKELAVAQLKQSQKVPEVKNDNTFANVTTLRKEIQQLPSYKNWAQAEPIYRTMLDSSTRDSKASDLNLVYGLGKIFDPNSVVREGELILVKDTASLPDWLVGSINSINGGARLQPETRAAIMAEAHSRASQYYDMVTQDTEPYRGIATQYNIRQEHVIPPIRPLPTPTAPKTKEPTKVIDGKSYYKRNGQWFEGTP
jgi:hypothetical protein